MVNPEVMKLYEEYLAQTDADKINHIWDEKSREFRDFWHSKIMNKEVKEISDEEIDKIVLILDRSASGQKKENEAVARTMVPQGKWRAMFRLFKSDEKLKIVMNNLFNETDDTNTMRLLEELYKLNIGRKNNLTGKAALPINAMLFAYNPTKYISVVSLYDRKHVINYFEFSGGPDFNNDPPGKQIILSNKSIINGFKALGI
jgi:hypothetical protein